MLDGHGILEANEERSSRADARTDEPVLCQNRAEGSAGEIGGADIGPEKEDCEESSEGTLGTIYILETIDRKFIKIGFTTDLTKRIQAHRVMVRSYLASDIRLIGYFPGTRRLETGLHRIFAPFKVHGEWYRRKALLGRISALEPKEIGPKRRLVPASASSMASALTLRRLATVAPARRAEIARNAAAARWKNKPRTVRPNGPKNSAALAMVDERMKKTTPAQRSEIARKAAKARWAKKGKR